MSLCRQVGRGSARLSVALVRPGAPALPVAPVFLQRRRPAAVPGAVPPREQAGGPPQRTWPDATHIDRGVPAAATFSPPFGGFRRRGSGSGFDRGGGATPSSGGHSAGPTPAAPRAYAAA